MTGGQSRPLIGGRPGMTQSLEDEFHEITIEFYKSAVSDCNYRAKAFLNMVIVGGAVETAKRLLSTEEIQAGMYDLYRCGRLDLTVEALMTETAEGKFRELFEPRQLEEAERRLEYFRSRS